MGKRNYLKKLKFYEKFFTIRIIFNTIFTNLLADIIQKIYIEGKKEFQRKQLKYMAK